MLRPQQGAKTGQMVYTGEEEDVPPKATKQTCTQGDCSFSTKTLALEGHDVTQDIHDVIQHLWRLWEVVVARVACSGGPRRPNAFLQEANVALERANVTLKGHVVLILLDLGFDYDI
jgi:hypothetical protein